MLHDMYPHRILSSRALEANAGNLRLCWEPLPQQEVSGRKRNGNIRFDYPKNHVNILKASGGWPAARTVGFVVDALCGFVLKERHLQCPGTPASTITADHHQLKMRFVKGDPTPIYVGIEFTQLHFSMQSAVCSDTLIRRWPSV